MTDPAPAAGLPSQPPDMDQVDRTDPVPWEWFDTLFVFLLYALTQVLVVAAVPDAFAEDPAPQDVATGLVIGATAMLVVCLGWAFWRGKLTGTPGVIRRLFGVRPPTLRDVGVGIGWGVGAFLVLIYGFGALLTTIIGLLGREVPPVQAGVQEAAVAAGAAPLLILLGAGLIGPIAEEVLFRGFLYQGLAKRMAGWPAVGLSGFAFGLLHVEPLVITTMFPFGMLLGWLMRRHGTLVVPIVAHVTSNVIVLGLLQVAEDLGV